MAGGRHRGWTVSAPGAKPVTYRSERSARRVARQVQDSSVSNGGGCLVALLTLPWMLLVTAVSEVTSEPEPDIDGHPCPGCRRASVPPNMVACKPCWFRLPRWIRNALWHSYRLFGPGSEAHTEALRVAYRWYQQH